MCAVLHKNCKDLSGQRFGKLIVLAATEARKNGHVVWECKCDCGNMTVMTTGALKGNRMPSCGCIKAGKIRVDLTGQRFGRLVAVKPTGEMRWGSEIWECKCDCGQTTRVIKSNLASGGTQSCGCLRHAPKKHTCDREKL